MSIGRLDETLTTDVLVIGGGAADVRAAVEAKNHGMDVILVVKGKFTCTGASFFPLMNAWGMQAAIFPDDSPDEHFQEIMDAAQGMCSVKLARILVEEAPNRLRDLEKWGVKFRKREGEFIRERGCFSCKERAVATENMENVRFVFQKQVKTMGINLLEDTMIADLLVQDGVCIGAVGVKENKKIILINAKSTIITTGGGSSIFKNSLSPSEVTGDGKVMALEAGAELFNMEFIQFIYAILYPKQLIFRERAFKVHPGIYNGHGDSYIEKYLPPEIDTSRVLNERGDHGPFTSRLVSRYFDIATYKEIIEGRASKHGGIYLDFRDMTEKEQKRYPMIDHWLQWLSQLNIDFSQTIFEIAPSAHALNGGIRINERAETNVEGLFAAGEAISGPHGADRLGGNMMSLTQVFGYRAGKYAAEHARKKIRVSLKREEVNRKLERIKWLSEKKGSQDPRDFLERIQEIMWQNVAICRTEDTLSNALAQLMNMEKNDLSHLKGDNIWEILSISNALKISQIITRACLLREETRGPHYREDFPSTDNEKFGQCLMVKKEGEKLIFLWKDINSLLTS